MSGTAHILIAETSSIVFEGLTGILAKSGGKFHISRTDSLDDVVQSSSKRAYDLVLINPSLVQNNLKTFNALKCQMASTKWIALVYALYDQQTLSVFDAFISITEAPQNIIILIHKVLNDDSQKEVNPAQDILSDREIDVLKLLATGLANKEIADNLNISINTVITHRKNISQKTGIKSVSGLTIYAVVKKLISLDSVSE